MTQTTWSRGPGPAQTADAEPVPPRLDLRGVSKSYPGVRANDSVDLAVMPGEIHAVLGENGAGKSTLMKIIYGVVQADRGEIRWDGRAVQIASPAHARALGIGMVFQHFSLFETLTVAENIALALDRSFDPRRLALEIESVSQRYGMPLAPDRTVHSLSVGERQRVEILRCLLQSPRLLIMDEPTSVLTPGAVRALFETLRRLSAEGCSVLYISHKLDEIRQLCHRATVMRGGRVTGTADPSAQTSADLARMMIGRELPVCAHPPAAGDGELRVQVERLSLPSDEPFGTDLRGIDLALRSGEILGLAGVSGNGQAELLAALSGERPLAPALAGRVRLCGRPVGHLDAGRRRDLGLVFVPEERLGRGAVPELSLADNVLLTAHRRGMLGLGLVRRGRVLAFAADCVERFAVRTAGLGHAAKSLSGGNLQKFIVGREILLEPRVLIAAQPTWGVDVGAAAAIRRALVELRDRGAAILLVSEELEELFEISDRIAVIAGGRLSPVRRTAETDMEEIGLWMGGLFPGGPGAGVEGADSAAVTP